GLKAPATFVRVAIAGLFDERTNRLEVLPMRLGQHVQIVERDRLVAGVVQTTDEHRVLGDGQSTLLEQLADPAIVEHLSNGAGIRAAGSAATGAAVMSGFMRVVQTGGAVTQDED